MGRPVSPGTSVADVVDHLDARLALSNTLEVDAIHYHDATLELVDDQGKRFLVTVTEVTP